jgi:sugar phosphate isomerase/epimerase
MRIGTQTAYISRYFSDEEALTVIRKAGFGTVDFSFHEKDIEGEYFSRPKKEFRQYFLDLLKYANTLDLEIGQTHAPFFWIKRHMEKYDKIMEVQKKCIAATAYLGCRYIVIHPLNMVERRYENGIEENKELNRKYYMELIPYLKEYDVYLAVENMFSVDPETKLICPTGCSSAEEMADYIFSFGERFVACLDIGHSNLIHQKGYEHINTRHMIETLGPLIKTLHIHDNDKKEDQHLPPFIGNIDWTDTMAALKKIGYSGDISLEADNFLSVIDRQYVLQSEKMMYACARRLYDMMV